MRRVILALCTIAALLLVSAPAHARSAGCGPRAAKTVAQSKLLRVFLQRPKSGVRVYYACLRSGSRPVRVADVDSFSNASGEYRGRLHKLLLRGRYVTAHTGSCRKAGSCDYTVAVVDVARRREVASEYDTIGHVVTLVATDRGEAAFLAYDALKGVFVVAKMDDFGFSERDRGDLRSLRLSGRRISWLDGETPRSESIAHVRRCGPGDPAYSALIGRHARVYGVDDEEGGDDTDWFACLYSGGRPLYLGSDLPGNSAYAYHGSFQIAGGYVGWFEYDCWSGGCNAGLRVADLRRRTIRTGRYHAPGTLLLNSRGFAAEITQLRYREAFYLYAFDSDGERLIDSGEGIDPASVELEADAITWRHGDENRREALR